MTARKRSSKWTGPSIGDTGRLWVLEALPKPYSPHYRSARGSAGWSIIAGVDHPEAVALLEKRRSAWLRHDLDTYLSLFAEDFVLYADGVEQLRGRAALKDTLRRNYERFHSIGWEFHEIAVHGQKVLAEWTVTLEEKESGSMRSMKAMFICEIRDGLATWQREYRVPASL